MANTTTSEVTSAVSAWLDKIMLNRALPSLVHSMFGQVRDLPANSGKVIKFRRYTALTPATTALTEGTTPTGSQLAITDVTATVAGYGDFVVLTDLLEMTTLDPLAAETAEVLGEQMGQTIDQIVRNVIVAGTAVSYAQSRGSRGAVVATDAVVAADFDKIVRSLKINNAGKINSMVNPDTGYNTTPVNASYVGIIHPSVAYTVRGFTGFKPVEQYANSVGKVLPGEFGAYNDIRFVETTFAKVFTGEGATAGDVYATLILGKEAYGVSRIQGKATEMIVKSLGSSGTADPLNQRSTAGWKASLAAAILNNAFMARLESGIVA